MLAWKNQGPVSYLGSRAHHRAGIAQIALAFGIVGARFTCAFHANFIHAALPACASGWALARFAHRSRAPAKTIANLGAIARSAHTVTGVGTVLGNEVAYAFGTCDVACDASAVARFGAADPVGAERRSAIIADAANFAIPALAARRTTAVDVHFVAVLDGVVALGASILVAIAATTLRSVDAFDAGA
jgi:hypothetical protein